MLQDRPEANSMPAAVCSMIMGLQYAGRSVLNDDKHFDQASYAPLMMVFRVSAPTLPRASSVGQNLSSTSSQLLFAQQCSRMCMRDLHIMP